MLEYIYFVKCPDCEDEHFFFFNDAKECAMSQLSKKPIITQVEVDRNDFGECTDSTDLGTIWSWEEVMAKPDSVETQSTFSKNDLTCKDVDNDPEFDALDNSVDFDFRKPVPADMTVEDLVEEMEENEDTVECKWCDELFDKSECRYEVDLGWLCDRCQQAIKSRGEQLTFREGTVDEAWKHDPFDHHDPDYDEYDAVEFEANMIDRTTDARYDNLLDESFKPYDNVEFNYDGLKVTLQGKKRAEDDWDEVEDTVSYTYYKEKNDVATDIWENFIQEADAKDIEGGLETLEDDSAWNNFLATHFDDLFDKYYDKLLKYYKEDAIREYEENHHLGESHKTFLEEFEEPDVYRERLADCPECGAEQSFDHETGICINCGFNI